MTTNSEYCKGYFELHSTYKKLITIIENSLLEIHGKDNRG